jgi:quinol monooxygenase YgiN
MVGPTGCVSSKTTLSATTAEAYPITLIAQVRVKAGKEEEYARLSRELVRVTLENEPGVGWYTVHRDKDDPQLFVFIESYSDESALNRHVETAHFKEYAAKMIPLEEGEPEIVLQARRIL